MAEHEQTPESAQEHRYRVFMLVEGLLLGLTVLFFPVAIQRDVGSWAIAFLCMWHCVAIPICLMYLIGKPIVMTLAPLIPSAESRAFRKRLAERPVLSDTDYYTRFWAETGIPIDIPIRLRRCLLVLDPLIERAIPDDNLCLIDDELDFVEVLHLVEQEFGVNFSRTDYKEIDGTLGNLLRLTYIKIHDLHC